MSAMTSAKAGSKAENHQFKPKPSRARESRTGSGSRKFLNHIRALTNHHNPFTFSSLNRGKFAGNSSVARGKIRHASQLYSQRVIVKARIVQIGKAGGVKALTAHIHYIERDGVGLDGGQAKVFSSESQQMERAGLNDWINSCADDRHQFRFIVSPENGGQLDIEQFTKDFMNQMEADLSTQLQWIAVAHHDTDNPHVHVVVRGVDENNGDLIISRDYMSRGARANAEMIATRELGHRTELDIKARITKDLTKDRLTGLDNQLVKDAQNHPENLIDLRKSPPAGYDFAQQVRNNKLQRLQHLESLGLAEEIAPGVWKMDDRLTDKLRSLGNRNDIIKTMHDKMRGVEHAAETVIFDKDNPPRKEIIGRVIHKGLADELKDTKYLIVAADDGKAYYLPLSRFSEAPGFEGAPGSIVTASVVEKQPVTRADKNIEAFAKNHGGIYDPNSHAAHVAQYMKLPKQVTPFDYVEGHVKRLEALKGRGLVERLDNGMWRVPGNLVERVINARGVGRDSGNFISIKVESYLPLKDQVHAPGPTWLDRQIALGEHDRPKSNRILSQFEIERNEALCARLAQLKQMGLADKPDFIERLYDKEHGAVTERLSRQYGRPVRLQPGQQLTGTMEKIERLSSGPHVVIRAGGEFAVIPLQKGMDRVTLGQQLTVLMDKPLGINTPTLPTMQQIRIRFALVDGIERQKSLGMGIKI